METGSLGGDAELSTAAKRVRARCKEHVNPPIFSATGKRNSYPFSGETLVPLLAGGSVGWKMVL